MNVVVVVVVDVDAVVDESVSLPPPSWRELLETLPMPRTIAFGARSLPDRDTERLPRSGVSVRIVPDAGHSMAFENASGLARVLRDALMG